MLPVCGRPVQMTRFDLPSPLPGASPDRKRSAGQDRASCVRRAVGVINGGAGGTVERMRYGRSTGHPRSEVLERRLHQFPITPHVGHNANRLSARRPDRPRSLTLQSAETRMRPPAIHTLCRTASSQASAHRGRWFDSRFVPPERLPGRIVLRERGPWHPLIQSRPLVKPAGASCSCGSWCRITRAPEASTTRTVDRTTASTFQGFISWTSKCAE